MDDNNNRYSHNLPETTSFERYETQSVGDDHFDSDQRKGKRREKSRRNKRKNRRSEKESFLKGGW